jgi:acetoin utilization deacetylase AcuC-like enzyme
MPENGVVAPLLSTGFCYDERCLLHDNGSMLVGDERVQHWLDVPHAERPERLTRTYALLERAGVLEQLERVPAREATEDELRLVHTREHVEAIRAACARGGLQIVGPGARASASSWEPAILAVGGLLETVDRVMDGRLANGFVLCRPPGHHASSERAMGFCLFNAVAVAARALQTRHALGRVAILDWDVHHGNGSQEIFYRDPSILFVSLHQDDLYPKGLGTLDQRGEDAGTGATVNVPLPAGSGDETYRLAFERVVAPALSRFRPQFVLVSAGQDSAAADSHGRMSVTTEGFRAMAAALKQLAEELCDGRLVAFLEGGYSLDHMPLCTLAIIEALAGLEPSWSTDPLEVDVPTRVTEAERQAVDDAVAASTVA